MLFSPRIYAMAVLSFFAASLPLFAEDAGVTTQTEEDDPEVRRIFFDEYPSAYSRLVKALSRVQGKASLRRRTNDPPLDQSTFLHFAKYDDYLKVRVATADEQPNVRDEAALLTPTQAALVRAPLTDAATPVMHGKEPNRRFEIFLNRSWRFFVESTFSLGTLRILPRLESGDLKYVTGHRHPSHPEWIEIHFTFSDNDLGGPTAHGTVDVLFDRNADWAIRRFRLHSVPYNFISDTRIESQLVQRLGVVPKTVHVEVHDLVQESPASPRNTLKLNEAITCDFLAFADLTEFRTDDFTLEALGITNAFSRRRWLLIVVGNFVFLAIFIAGFVRWRRHSRR